MTRLSKAWYLSILVGVSLLGETSSILYKTANDKVLANWAGNHIGLFLAGMGVYVILVILVLLVGLRFLYRMWSVFPKNEVRMTPFMAQGLSLIPVFNLYWHFETMWGFTKDYNRYIERRGFHLEKLPDKLFLWYCILTAIEGVIVYTSHFLLTSLLPYTIIIIYPMYVFDALIILKVCDAVNLLPVPITQEPSETEFKAFRRWSAILGLTVLVLLVIGGGIYLTKEFYGSYYPASYSKDAQATMNAIAQASDYYRNDIKHNPANVEELKKGGYLTIDPRTDREWNFSFEGADTLTIRATSTKAMRDGEGKIVRMDEKTRKFTGYGIK